MKNRTAPPVVEKLELRDVPAFLIPIGASNFVLTPITPAPPTITPSSAVTLTGGNLKIQGTESADIVSINRAANNKIVVQTSGALGVHLNSYDRSQVSKITFNARYGDDVLFVDSIGIDVPITAYGGHGDDLLQGGRGNDSLYGEGGHDKLSGAGGNDLLDGSSGNDQLFGGDGNDSLKGGAGYDQLFGHAGNDRLDGGYDGIADRLEGGTGADTFVVHKKAKFLGWKTYNEDIVDRRSSEGDKISYDHHLLGP